MYVLVGRRILKNIGIHKVNYVYEAFPFHLVGLFVGALVGSFVGRVVGLEVIAVGRRVGKEVGTLCNFRLISCTDVHVRTSLDTLIYIHMCVYVYICARRTLTQAGTNQFYPYLVGLRVDCVVGTFEGRRDGINVGSLVGV